jgi:hypothetical protein
MPPPSRQLSLAELTHARRAYEGGQTFAEIGQRHGMSEAGMRRLLCSVGIVPRARGKAPTELPPLVLEDARAGLSAHEIARKHAVPRHRVNAFLRQHGLARAPRQRVVKPLGSRVTNLQAHHRRKPPMKIPMRTPEERRLRRWTGPELAAIAQALRAGRVTFAPRGRSGLPEPSRATWQAAGIAFVTAMRRLRAA